LAKTKGRINTKTTSKPALSPLIIGVVVIVSILLVAGLILLGTTQSSAVNAPADISQFPAKGSIDAPITLIEFLDYG
jgi:hypothetical protein